nr:DUF2155 domain-containing protein [Sphingomicrobium nitratireducens]
MGERVAVIGLLNKRNNLVENLELKPGQAQRVGDAIVRLRACETTAPWEPEKLTGAFIQLDVRRRGSNQYDRVFSGWIYKESPSLNVVEHPVYDVWPKSCTMSFPEGPAAPAARTGSSNLSSATSEGGDEAPAEETPSAEASEAPEVPDDNA